MASFMRRAMVTIGLADEDEDDIDRYDRYDGYDYEEDEITRPATLGRRVEPPAMRPEPQRPASTLRPVASRPAPARVMRPAERPEASQKLQDAQRTSQPVARVTRESLIGAQISAKPFVVAPKKYSDAQQIGDHLKAEQPVIVNLQVVERELARRMIDFCSGLTYALNGSMEKVADQVFLLTPSNVEVSKEERERIQRHGLFQ